MLEHDPRALRQNGRRKNFHQGAGRASGLNVGVGGIGKDEIERPLVPKIGGLDGARHHADRVAHGERLDVFAQRGERLAAAFDERDMLSATRKGLETEGASSRIKVENARARHPATAGFEDRKERFPHPVGRRARFVAFGGAEQA